MALVFDCETNGLLDKVSKVHSLVIYDTETCITWSCSDNSYKPDKVSTQFVNIAYGLRLLQEAEEVIGHNIIKYDIPVLEKLYPDFKIKGKVFDTLIASRLAFPDIENIDYKYQRQGKYFIPGATRKKPYSLEAWGYRLGVLKGDYGKQDNAWDKWTPEMQEYCEQDVVVTTSLYNTLVEPKNKKRALVTDCLELEFKFAQIISLQEQRGVCFNKDKAISLLGTLRQRKLELVPEVKKYFKDKIKQIPFVPKRDDISKGYVAGVTFIKKKRIPFNPNSRDMIREQLLKFWDWKPIKKTKTGNWSLDKEVLADMVNEKKMVDGELVPKYPFALALEEYFIIEKLLGSLSTGKESWLNHLTSEGKIHGNVNTTGAVTGRCTHNNPNLAQIPAVGKPFGKECRELFEASKGFKLVGVDASGLEFRCLAHYINDPKINKTVIEGIKEDGTDIHSLNKKILQEIEPKASRDDAKTYIYAWMYGGGNTKLGSIIGKPTAVGKKLRELFLSKYPALKKVIKGAEDQVKAKGYIRGIDGRYVAVQSSHTALNYTLQGAGAIVMKKACCILYDDLLELGWVWGKDFAFVLNIHDEIQAEVRDELVEEYKKLAVRAIQKAGEYFNFKCPLDGEAKEGMSWAQTH